MLKSRNKQGDPIHFKKKKKEQKSALAQYTEFKEKGMLCHGTMGQKQSGVRQSSRAYEHVYSRDKPEQGLGGRMAVSRSASIS